MDRTLRLRYAAPIAALVALATALAPSASHGAASLSDRVSAGQQQAGALSARIQAESSKIQGYEGTIGSLQGRLSVIERSVIAQEQQLSRVRAQLSAARNRLTLLVRDYARDRQVLATQLLARYESPPPTIVDVIVDSNGFNNLLNRLRDLKTIEQQDSRATSLVKSVRGSVTAQTRTLAQEEIRRQRATAAVIVERDQVAQLKLSIVNRELVFARAKQRDTTKLTSLRRTLTRESRILEQRAVAAQAASFATGGVAPSGCINTPFVPHGGSTGFFPAAGTNYSVGQEPIIAARLDSLGRVLGLQLTGISGYRSPAHSVEVGGFADDPHTQGLASDTPGVEGVPESTLVRFCLTRPFPGPREADHIQES
jgi:peptidoglycan hydrolase CwlO-like protein